MSRLLPSPPSTSFSRIVPHTVPDGINNLEGPTALRSCKDDVDEWRGYSLLVMVWERMVDALERGVVAGGKRVG